MGNKRKSEEKKLEKYRKKIRKIEERREKGSRATTPGSAIFLNRDPISSDHEIYHNVSDEENQLPSRHEGDNNNSAHVEQIEPTTNQSPTVSLSSEVINALGDTLPEQPKFSPKICDDVARILNTILKCGLKKEAKVTLLEELVPENCSLLIAPKMNMDIITAIGDKIHNRDKKIESEQNQLGLGLSILCKTLSALTVSDSIDRLKLISSLCNAVRILADLHSIQTRARKNLTLPNQDKPFLNLVKDVQRDEFLFGDDLHLKISAMNNSKKNARAIKKPFPNQGNYSGPSRYHQTGSKAVMRNGPKKPLVVRNFQGQHYQQYQNQQRLPKRKYPDSVKDKPHAPTPK